MEHGIHSTHMGPYREGIANVSGHNFNALTNPLRQIAEVSDRALSVVMHQRPHPCALQLERLYQVTSDEASSPRNQHRSPLPTHGCPSPFLAIHSARVASRVCSHSNVGSQPTASPMCARLPHW